MMKGRSEHVWVHCFEPGAPADERTSGGRYVDRGTPVLTLLEDLGMAPR